MLNLLGLPLQMKLKLFIIVFAIGLAIFFFIKSSIIEQKLQKLKKARENIHHNKPAIKKDEKEQKQKFSVFQNSITVSLDDKTVCQYEALYGKLTDFAIETRIDKYGIDKELTDNEISQIFEAALLEEMEEKYAKE